LKTNKAADTAASQR